MACRASARGCTAYWLLAEKSYSARGEPSSENSGLENGDQTFEVIIVMDTVSLALNRYEPLNRIWIRFYIWCRHESIINLVMLFMPYCQSLV